MASSKKEMATPSDERTLIGNLLNGKPPLLINYFPQK